MMRFLVAALNPQPAGQILWPSFELLLDLAKTAPLTLFAAKPDYEKSLIQMLEGITQAGEELYLNFGGLDIERDIVRPARSVVLDVCGLGPPWVRAISNDILVLQLLLGRQYRYQRSDRVDCILAIDEADQDVSRKAEAAFPDLSPLSVLLKQGREYGLAAVLGLSAIGPWLGRLAELLQERSQQPRKAAVHGQGDVGAPLQGGLYRVVHDGQGRSPPAQQASP